MKETAIKYLLSHLPQIDYGKDDEYKEIIAKAIQMEQSQICTAYVFGAAYGINMKDGLNPNNYYNETYQKTNL
jgi:hypothetical protein